MLDLWSALTGTASVFNSTPTISNDNGLPVTPILAGIPTLPLPSGAGRSATLCMTSGPHRTAPWIHITSPNGGEVYITGQRITVTWTSCNIPGNATGSITLDDYHSQSSQGLNNGVSENFPNTGSAVVILPPAGSGIYDSNTPTDFGKYFKVGISYSVFSPQFETIAQDLSDGLFTVNDSR